MQLEPFLTKFRTRRSMFPLLFESILAHVKLLMAKFIKADVLAASDSAIKVMALDLNNPFNRLPVPEVGFSAAEALKKSKAGEDLKSTFYVECRLFLVQCVEKILERSPLKYKFVRASSCLSPLLLATKPGLCRQRMQTLLELLVQAKWASGDIVDRVKSQFLAFSQNSVVAEQFRAFVKNKVPLDQFFVKVFHDVTGYDDLFFVVRLTLLMSHGNATVESGFSVNQDMLIENLQEESLVAQSLVYDAIHSVGGPLKKQLTPELLKSVSRAYKRYSQALEEKRTVEQNLKLQHGRKRKAITDNMVKLSEEKRALDTRNAVRLAEIDKKMVELQRTLKDDA